MKLTQRLTVALALTALVSVPAFGADVYVDPTEVLWAAKSGNTMVLNVTGPGVEFSQTFENGDIPFFSLYDKNGQPLADGQYSWQLTTIPTLDGATQKAMEAARVEGRAASRELMADLPQGEKFSGVVRVLDGSFLSQVGVEPVNDQDAGDKAQVFATDLIVQGSACVGLDCATNESFGFDTLKLKENNLRIKFEDTSASANFPGNDWELTANDSSNGGANRFSIQDVTNNRTPFTVLANAPNNSLYVNASGDVGVGTASPALELHIVDGDSPSIRLQQDGSAGFATRTWDLAGNETNFFVRDVENSSALPFRIRAGAPDKALYIDTDGDVMLGGQNPSAKLDVTGSAEINGALTVNTTDVATPFVVTESGTASARVMAKFANNGGVRMDLTNTQNSRTWRFDHGSNGALGLDFGGDTVNEVTVYGVAVGAFNAGDMAVSGDVYAGGVMLTSDVHKKTAFESVNGSAVLDAIASMPITTWEYKDRAATRHMGPMAQDFYAAFGLGSSERHISAVDAAGVSLAAVQALNAELEQEIADKDAQLQSLNERLAALEALLLD